MYGPVTTDLNHTISLTTAREAVKLVLSQCRRPIVTTKFGPDSAVLLHVVSQLKTDIPIVWVDTGFNSTATLEFADELSRFLGLNVHRFAPVLPEATVPRAPEDDGYDAFVQAVKLEPFRRAMQTLGADAWLSSIRRYQSDFRRQQRVFESRQSAVLKVSPMLDWSPESVEHYLGAHALPVGPACYDPTKPSERQECGLHVPRPESGDTARATVAC